jgi:hypothetical protein
MGLAPDLTRTSVMSDVLILPMMTALGLLLENASIVWRMRIVITMDSACAILSGTARMTVRSIRGCAIQFVMDVPDLTITSVLLVRTIVVVLHSASATPNGLERIAQYGQELVHRLV